MVFHTCHFMFTYHINVIRLNKILSIHVVLSRVHFGLTIILKKHLKTIKTKVVCMYLKLLQYICVRLLVKRYFEVTARANSYVNMYRAKSHILNSLPFKSITKKRYIHKQIYERFQNIFKVLNHF